MQQVLAGTKTWEFTDDSFTFSRLRGSWQLRKVYLNSYFSEIQLSLGQGCSSVGWESGHVSDSPVWWWIFLPVNFQCSLLQCSSSSRAPSHVLTSVCMFKISSVGSHTIVWTHTNTAHIWSILGDGMWLLKWLGNCGRPQMQFVSWKTGDHLHKKRNAAEVNLDVDLPTIASGMLLRSSTSVDGPSPGLVFMLTGGLWFSGTWALGPSLVIRRRGIEAARRPQQLPWHTSLLTNTKICVWCGHTSMHSQSGVKLWSHTPAYARSTLQEPRAWRHSVHKRFVPAAFKSLTLEATSWFATSKLD